MNRSLESPSTSTSSRPSRSERRWVSCRVRRPVEPVVFGRRIPVLLERRERKTARFSFEVPNTAKRLHVAVLGATRDVDLFLKRGGPPIGKSTGKCGSEWPTL